MDPATRQTQLESELRSVEGFKTHPIMAAILRDNAEQQQVCINLLCEETVTDIGSFFAHFAALGHLRGLRRMPGLIEDKLEEIRQQLVENE